MRKSGATITTYLVVAGAALLSTVLPSESAHAYIGPGAGFAFLGSTAVLLVAVGMGIVTLLLWPLTAIWRKIRGKGIGKSARSRRVVIVGLDGLEPSLTEKYMHEGKLPHLAQLKAEGAYSKLGTTLPALSPVAWSTFQTGVNPGAHNIFDFLTRDKRFFLPQLASTETEDTSRKIGWGPLAITLGGPRVRLTRKSKPFWKILGEQGIHSTIIRIPISYPPEPFEGNILSAMCTPDLKGTQGSFSYFSTVNAERAQGTGGTFRTFEQRGSDLSFLVEGPPSPRGKGYLTAACTLSVLNDQEADLLIEGSKTSVRLKRGEYSEWLELPFFHGRTKIFGIARFLLRESGEKTSLYVSPVNVHPEHPALPISAPSFFSQWYAKRLGPFGTLGLMEDTWGRNEYALNDREFLDQAYLAHQEREKMFFDALARTREGVCACVFDASDRIQHMFWRYLDDKHPSSKESEEFKSTIPQMYERMDALVGKVRAALTPHDTLIVLSDHGFASFRRGINLNTWLYREGYLALKNNRISGEDYFQDVDWEKTKAFACGLTGIYLNREGRERGGIVDSQEAEVLKREIAAKLEKIEDPLDGSRAIRKVYQASESYSGLYVEEAPDLIIGYAPGYRVSWESITGMLEQEIFSNNMKAWSGDHHVDPKEIPGIFFSNRPLKREAPAIVDMAPTVLDILGVKAPRYMEGSSVL